MPYSTADKCKKLVSNPEALAVLEKYCPGMSTNPSFPMAYGMAFKSLAAFPQTKLTPEKLAAMDEELAKIAD